MLLKQQAMKTIKLFALSVLVLLLGTTSCIYDTIHGNGISVSEERVTTNFNKIANTGSFIVHVSNDESYEVIVNAEENIIPYIETYVSGGTLYIDIDRYISLSNTKPMEVYVSMPNLKGLKLSGSGRINTEFFETNEMDIILSGSGRIETSCKSSKVEASIPGSGTVNISGETDYAEFKISGSGNINATTLFTDTCYSSITGSGEIKTTVENLLGVRITGSGNVYYSGDPEVNQNISGSGRVVHLD